MSAPRLIVIAGVAASMVLPDMAAEGRPRLSHLWSEESEQIKAEMRRGNVVLAKTFCVALRRNDQASLRKMISPGYLGRFDIEEGGAGAVETAPVMGIYNIIAGDDPGTVLCLYTTKEGQKEAMVLVMTRENGRPYVVPPGTPDPEKKTFVPWSLRTEIGGFADTTKEWEE